MAWKTRLRAYLNGEGTLTEAQATSHRDCDLGKWLYSEGLAKYSGIVEMRQLESEHTHLHALVKDIMRSKNAGDSAGAEHHFADLQTSSQKIVGLLTDIEHKVK